VLDDCLSLCESPTNIFMKLYIHSHDKMLTEWAIDHVIQNRGKVAKELAKCCVSGLEEVKADYLMRVPEESVKVVGSAYLRVTKTYVLVE
jgi:hypothetical protein